MLYVKNYCRCCWNVDYRMIQKVWLRRLFSKIMSINVKTSTTKVGWGRLLNSCKFLTFCTVYKWLESNIYGKMCAIPINFLLETNLDWFMKWVGTQILIKGTCLTFRCSFRKTNLATLNTVRCQQDIVRRNLCLLLLIFSF